MGDVTEANIERALSRVESLGPRIENSLASDKNLLTVSKFQLFQRKIDISKITTASFNLTFELDRED